MLDPGEARFATALFQAISSSAANIFVSPASVRIAMAMLYAGAGGETAEELRRVLHFGSVAETVERFATLHRALAARPAPSPWGGASPEVLLELANRLWPCAGLPLLEPFARVIREGFAADVERLDYVTDSEAARRRINAWVAERTAQKIRDLLGPSDVSSATAMVVTNAAYFLGAWTHPFTEGLTKRAPFHAPGGDVTVQMMESTEHYPYAEVRGAQVIELGYGYGQVCMRVALPRAGEPLPLALPNDGALSLEMRRVHLSFPRFRVEVRLSLADTLAGMGMPSLFCYPGADLSGIDGTRELYVSNVVHQTFVETNERGTEAAAATAAAVAYGGISQDPARPVELRVDRPFLFWILHPETGTVLFSGRLSTPST